MVYSIVPTHYKTFGKEFLTISVALHENLNINKLFLDSMAMVAQLYWCKLKMNTARMRAIANISDG